MNRLILNIIFILLAIHIFAQDSLKKKKLGFPQIIEVNTGYGFIAKHRPIVDYFITGHVPTLNISVGKIMNGNKLWHQKYGNPEIGVGLYYANFNNKYLGDSYALYGYSKIPITNRTSKAFLYFDLGLGLAYITKHFSINENYYNIVIGSHFNAYLRVGLLANIRITDKFSIITGLSLNHSSNSKTQTPNLGINVISYNLGLNYKLYNTNFNTIDNIIDCDCYNSYYLTISAGNKAVPNPQVAAYFAGSLVFDYVKNISFKSGFGAGADVFYDTSYEYTYKKDSVNYNTTTDFMQAGLHATYILKFNKIWFNLNLGYYVYDKLRINGDIYSRISMRAFIYKNIYASVGMKTHFAKADLLELGLGYNLY